MGADRRISGRTYIHALFVGLFIVTVFVTIGFTWLAVNAAETRQASDKATVASDKATAVLVRLATVQDQVFQEKVKTEKICTDSHPENCQALFDRLLKHTTSRQARRWVCDGLAHIYQAPVVVYLRRRTRCPPPTPPERPMR